MVRMERKAVWQCPEKYEWFAEHGAVYAVNSGEGTPIRAWLYWAYLGAEGCYAHLDAVGDVPPLWAAAAMRFGLREVLPGRIILTQTQEDSRMHRLLTAFGFRETEQYRTEDADKPWHIMLYVRDFSGKAEENPRNGLTGKTSALS